MKLGEAYTDPHAEPMEDSSVAEEMQKVLDHFEQRYDTVSAERHKFSADYARGWDQAREVLNGIISRNYKGIRSH